MHRERPAARLAEDDTDLLLRGDSESPRGVRTERCYRYGIRAGNRRLGSTGSGSCAFGEDTLSALQDMADQLGGAIASPVPSWRPRELCARPGRRWDRLAGIGLRALPGEVSATEAAGRNGGADKDGWEDDVSQAVAENHTVRQIERWSSRAQWDTAVGRCACRSGRAPGWTEREIFWLETPSSNWGTHWRAHVCALNCVQQSADRTRARDGGASKRH